MNTTIEIRTSELKPGDRIFFPATEALALSFDGPGQRVNIPAKTFVVDEVSIRTNAIYAYGHYEGKTKTTRKMFSTTGRVEVTP